MRYRAGVPITEDNFDGALPVPHGPVLANGQPMLVVAGGLRPETHYYFGVRTVGPCGQLSKLSTVDVQTPKTPYTTLHGCFVATAAFGSALAPAVESLRRARDRWLLPDPLGEKLVALYYLTSPPLARSIADDPELRRAARSLLVPFVAVAGWLDKDR